MGQKLILGILFTLLAGFSAHAGDSDSTSIPIADQLTFYLLDMESGLAHNVVNSIEQDELGYIWIATIEGISRYNGRDFLNFKQRGQAFNGSLANNYVQQIKRRKNGDLMIATDGGLNFYQLKKEKFDLIEQNDGLLTNNISSLFESPEGKIIIGGYRYGIQILNSNGQIETSLTHNRTDPSSLSSNQVTALTMQGDSVVWIGTFDGGLNKLNLTTNRLERLFQKTPEGTPAQINALYTDESGNIWMGTRLGAKIITTAGDTLSIDQGDSAGEGLSDREVLCFEQDGQNNMWIGTRNGGLTILSISDLLHKQQVTTSWFLPKTDGSGVFNRTVTALKRDNDGNMWIGTSTGVNFVNPNGEPIKLLHKNPALQETLGHNRIGALAVGTNQKIWIGTDGGGLDLYDPTEKSFKNFSQLDKVSTSITNNYIIALLQDSKDRLWAGTYQGGLNRLDQSTGQFNHYLQGNVQDGADVRVVAEDRQQQIWVGTNQGGLYRYAEQDDKFEYIHQLGKIDIRGIAVDKTDRLWLATFGSGIILYDPQTEEITHYNITLYGDLPGNIYFCIYVLPNDDVLIGSRYGGLVRLNPRNNSFQIFTEADGLGNNTINSMVMDNQGVVWMGTYNGISYYNPNSHQIGHLNTYDNFQRSEFNIGAAIYSPAGRLYFGGNKGLNYFNPSKLERSVQDYPFVFENFKLFNERVNVSKELLDSAISYKKTLTLTHQQTLFSFDFAVIKYPFAQHIDYAYKLENYNEHWIQVNDKGTANLSNIPPGTYNLQVKAKISQDQEIERNIQLIITPPFWKTFPAYLLYVFVLTGIVNGSLRYYSERIKLKSSLELEKKQRILEHDVNEEKLRFFTSFSHELKTPLTLILAPLEDLLQQVKLKTQLNKLALIQKNAVYLHKLIGNMLEFRKSETGMSKMLIREHNLSMYLDQWIRNYLPLAKRKTIQLTFSFSERNLMARFDFEKLEIIINNLISNAIKYCDALDKIHIRLWSDETSILISVKDTGPGIPVEDREHIFDWYFQSASKLTKSGTGIGLALSKNLIELHGGTLAVESNSPRGSVFIVTLPKSLEITTNDNSTTSDPYVHQLPVALSKPLELPPFLEPEPEGEREVVLLIDDNADMIDYLKSLLASDYTLMEAENGQEGLDKALKFVPDLIISDIMMPNRDGFDLCSTLKQNDATSHIPVILLSAKDSMESIQTGFQEGADDYITKPFNSVMLQTRVTNLLTNRKTLRKHFLGQEEIGEEMGQKETKLLTAEKKFLSVLNEIILGQIGKEETQVDNVVQEMGMSRTSLFRKVKAITGYNINAYIRMIKVNKAANLIATHNVPISQAAFESGFNDIKYFRKVFKEHFGQLPSAYKNN